MLQLSCVVSNNTPGRSSPQALSTGQPLCLGMALSTVIAVPWGGGGVGWCLSCPRCRWGMGTESFRSCPAPQAVRDKLETPGVGWRRISSLPRASGRHNPVTWTFYVKLVHFRRSALSFCFYFSLSGICFLGWTWKVWLFYSYLFYTENWNSALGPRNPT